MVVAIEVGVVYNNRTFSCYALSLFGRDGELGHTGRNA